MSLTDKTISDLRVAFEGHKHRPSEAMYEAITDVAQTIEKMVDGTAKRVFYVSSLDPGVGKTQTIIHALRNLPKDVGVLICVSRKEEIKSLMRDMGLTKDETGIYTADPGLNIEGAANTDRARVLFTTQQMVDSRLKDGKKFKDLGVFHYRGKPRAVRIWDESMLPGEELTLSIDNLARIPSRLRRMDQKLKDRLYEDLSKIRKLSEGSTYQVPDLEGEYGLDIIDKAIILERIKTKDRGDRQAMETLWRLSGKLVHVVRDASGNTILDYHDHLPDDFAPVLILDASARVRRTYALWAQSKGNLVPLKAANKSYRNLTLHHWNTGGGKDSWRKKQDRLIEGIAATINTKPDEDWLVVIHKDEETKKGIPDLEVIIGDLVKGERERVRYITWGNHHATNDYVDIENVILAGTLFYPPSTYEVRARASKGIKANERLSADDFHEMELGEHSHLILQALCRGSVRKCMSDACAPCNGYLIASKGTGINADLLAQIFPGCQVRDWQPVAKPLRGKVREAIELVQDWVAGVDDGARLTFNEHRKALGMANRQNYNRTIRKNAAFVDALRELGVYEGSGGAGYNTHFLKWSEPANDTDPIQSDWERYGKAMVDAPELVPFEDWLKWAA